MTTHADGPNLFSGPLGAGLAAGQGARRRPAARPGSAITPWRAGAVAGDDAGYD
ncbi:hypothetical protein [Streptomyces sp. LS1784]|uniref:hypothetical protein n=1 Tax=Streptomyces sp. LS1784 TaxID=2851533 RepID=UPI001CCC5145|nr:hypothetical protein [Streptomyces sp. LS1784]